VAKPIPVAPPVIKTTLFSNLFIVLSSLLGASRRGGKVYPLMIDQIMFVKVHSTG
jgi:hypothetical protein